MIAANHPVDGVLAQGRDRLRSGGDNHNAVLGPEEPGEDREGLWEHTARGGESLTHTDPVRLVADSWLITHH